MIIAFISVFLKEPINKSCMTRYGNGKKVQTILKFERLYYERKKKIDVGN